MFRISRGLFLGLILTALWLIASFVLAFGAKAQEATPEPDTIVVEEGGTVVVNEAEEPPATNPALASMLAMAAAVGGAVQTIKPWFNKLKDEYGWSDDLHTFVVRLVAFGISLALMFLVETNADIVQAFDLKLSLPPLVVKVITAFAISMGASLIWALFRLFKFLPGMAVIPAAVINTTEVRRP